MPISTDRAAEGSDHMDPCADGTALGCARLPSDTPPSPICAKSRFRSRDATAQALPAGEAEAPRDCADGVAKHIAAGVEPRPGGVAPCSGLPTCMWLPAADDAGDADEACAA